MRQNDEPCWVNVASWTRRYHLVFFEVAAKLIEPARIHRSLVLRKMRRCASDLAFTAGND